MQISKEQKDVKPNLRFLILRTFVSGLVAYAIIFSFFHDISDIKDFTNTDLDIGFQCSTDRAFCAFKIAAVISSIILLLPGIIETTIVSVIFLRVSSDGFLDRRICSFCFKVDENDNRDLSNSEYIDKNLVNINKMSCLKFALATMFTFLLLSLLSVILYEAAAFAICYLVARLLQRFTACDNGECASCFKDMIATWVVPFLRPAEYVLLACLSTLLIYNANSAGDVLVNTTAVQIFAKLPDEFVNGMFHPTKNVKEVLYKYLSPGTQKVDTEVVVV